MKYFILLKFIDQSLLITTLENFYAKYPQGPDQLIIKLIKNFQVFTVQTDSLQRRYDEMLLSVFLIYIK